MSGKLTELQLLNGFRSNSKPIKGRERTSSVVRHSTLLYVSLPMDPFKMILNARLRGRCERLTFSRWNLCHSVLQLVSHPRYFWKGPVVPNLLRGRYWCGSREFSTDTKGADTQSNIARNVAEVGLFSTHQHFVQQSQIAPYMALNIDSLRQCAQCCTVCP